MRWFRSCLPVVVVGMMGLAGAGAKTGAQEKPARLTFDVASIRPSKPGLVSGGIKPLPGGTGYTAQNVPVKLMMALMYKVPMRQIEGGPEWLATENYDVEARADGSYTIDELHTMFQNLLADRFGLKFHTETRDGNVYALMVDAPGVKMKPDGTGQALAIPITFGADGHVIGTRVPMTYLTWWLGQVLQRDERPVIDKTGLQQSYDFTLSFAPVLPPDVTRESQPGVAELPSIFDALKQQLGLKLVAEKGPVVHDVIDRVERPSEN